MNVLLSFPFPCIVCFPSHLSSYRYPISYSVIHVSPTDTSSLLLTAFINEWSYRFISSSPVYLRLMLPDYIWLGIFSLMMVSAIVWWVSLKTASWGGYFLNNTERLDPHTRSLDGYRANGKLGCERKTLASLCEPFPGGQFNCEECSGLFSKVAVLFVLLKSRGKTL